MGIAVFAGMLGVTLFGLFLTPVFYVVVQGWRPGVARRGNAAAVRPCAATGGGTLIVRTQSSSVAGSVLAWWLGVRCGRAASAPAARCRHDATARRGAAQRALVDWDASACLGSAFDPRWWRQFEDPVLESSRPPRSRRTTTSGRRWRGSIRRGRSSTRAQRDRYPTVTAGASVDVREQVHPGLHRSAGRASTPIAPASTRLGARLLRPRACRRSPPRRRTPRASRRRSTTCASAWPPKSRATTSSCAAFSSSWRWLERSLANQRETLRLTVVRRDAGIGEEQDVASASARVAAIEAGAAAAADGAGGARASAGAC